MLSINTDTGRMAAIRVMSDTDAMARTIQQRIGTGQKVASAKDDGAAFAIAQNARGDIASFAALEESRARTLGLLDTSMAGLGSISDLLIQLKQLATAASDTSLDTAARAALDSQYQAMLGDIDNISSSSSIHGNNLLDSNASNFVTYGAGALPAGIKPLTWDHAGATGVSTGEPQPGDALTLHYGFAVQGTQPENVSGLVDFKLRYFDGTSWTVLPLGATVNVPNTTTISPGSAQAFTGSATMPALPATATAVEVYGVFRGQVPYPDGANVDESAGTPSDYPYAPETPALLASWNQHDWQTTGAQTTWGGYNITTNTIPPTPNSTEAGKPVSGSMTLSNPDSGYSVAGVDYSISYVAGDASGARIPVTTTANQNIALSTPPAASLTLPYALTIPATPAGHTMAGMVANVTVTHDVPPQGTTDGSTATDSTVTGSGILAGQPHITIANAIAQGKSFSYAVQDAAATGLQVDTTTVTPSFEWYNGTSWNSIAMSPATVDGAAVGGSFVLPSVAGPITKARITAAVDVTTSDPLDPLATPTTESHSLTLLDWDKSALVTTTRHIEFASNATVTKQYASVHSVERNAKLETVDSIRADVAVVRRAHMTTAGTKGLLLYGSSLADPDAAMDAIARLQHAQLLAHDAAQYYGEKIHRFENLEQNDTVTANAYKTAVGRLTDADMATEAAALAAVRVKQQLAAQSLAIANAAPSVLLSLFR